MITSRNASGLVVTDTEYLLPTGTLPRVTSILATVSNPDLLAWTARLAAEYAVQDRDHLSGLEDDEAVSLVKGAPTRYLQAAALLGTRVHQGVEDLVRGGSLDDQHPDVHGHLRSWIDFAERYRPEVLASEVVCIGAGYAGTIDLVVRVDLQDGHGPGIYVVDVKTGKSVRGESVALQLGAYRAAGRIYVEGGEEVAPWAGKVIGGLVLHLRPRSGAIVPVATGSGVLQRFEALKLLHAWQTIDGRTALGGRVKLDPKRVG